MMTCPVVSQHIDKEFKEKMINLQNKQRKKRLKMVLIKMERRIK